MARLALTLSLLLLSTVQGRLRLSENGATLFKNIRSLMADQLSSSFSDERDLQSKDYTTIRCFYECTEQKMTATQCEAFIKSVIGEDLTLHEIPDLKIKVRSPRTKEAVSESYFMIGIPVNIYGEVDCELNNAVITHPWLWSVGGVDYSIPDTNCQNLNADECCTKVMQNVVDAGIPRVDDQGNCLSCWVHQEPLEPIISDATGNLAYIERDFVGGTCLERELDRGTVQTEDDSVEAKLAIQSIIMESYISNGATCQQLRALQKALMLNARSFAYAENLIANLLCGYCIDVSTYEVLPQELVDTLYIIIDEISGEINSDTNEIIIYTDRHDNVIEPPKIGGSRAGLDIDLDDPDCPPETTGDSPVSSPVLPPFGGSTPIASPTIETAPVSSPVAPPVSAPIAEPPVEAPVSPVAPPVGVTSPVSSPVEVPPVAAPVSPVAPPVGVTSPVSSPVGVPPVAAPASPVAPPVGVTSPVSSPIAEAPIGGTPPLGGSIPVSSPLSATPPTGCPATMTMVGETCVCPAGKYVGRGGKSCSSDPGDACPEGSYLTKAGTCLDCNCGFCQSSRASHASCCTINGAGNNCHSVGSREENCRFNANFFPGYSDQTGDVCSGVEVKMGAQIPVGCGCKPSSTAACSYDKSKNSCFVCSAEDLANVPSSGCASCKSCLVTSCAAKWSSDKKNYDFCKNISFSTLTQSQWQQCFAYSAANSSNKYPDCALNCSDKCMKM